MNKRLLVKYLYKGKIFTLALSAGDESKYFLIGKKLIIGSDSDLMWQIFNPSFPPRHDLIIKEDNSTYYLNLLSSFSIDISHDDKSLDLEELNNSGILKENRLYLREGYSGSIQIDKNTVITYEFIPPLLPLSSEQKKMKDIFFKYPKLNQYQKITRFTISLVAIFIITFASIIGWTYSPPARKTIFDKTETEALVRMQVEAPLDFKVPVKEEPASQMTTYDASASQNSQAGDYQEETAEVERIAAQRQRERSSSDRPIRLDRTSLGNNNVTSTGPAQIVVKSRVRGLSGSNRRIQPGYNIQVDTESKYGSASSALTRQAGDQSNKVVVSGAGVDYDKISSRENIAQFDGTTDMKEVSANLTAKRVDTITDTEVTASLLNKDQVTSIDKPKRDIRDADKKSIVNEWFDELIHRQISRRIDSFRLRKRGIRGELSYTLIFRNDKVVNAVITGSGTINDQELISEIKNLIVNKICSGIGNYQIKIKKLYD